MTATAPFVAGTPFQVTVTAKDAVFNVDRAYRGRVSIHSTDPSTPTPLAAYTLTATDRGSHTFTVTLPTAGARVLTVRDTSCTTLTGSTGVTITTSTARTLWSWDPTFGQLGKRHLRDVSTRIGLGTGRFPGRLGGRRRW